MIHESKRDFEPGSFVGGRAVPPPHSGIQLSQPGEWGSFTSADISAPHAFRSLVLSANFSTRLPGSLGIVGLVAVRFMQEWSPWFRLLRWGSPVRQEGATQSQSAQVDVDVLTLREPARAVRYAIHWQSGDPTCRLTRVALSLQGDAKAALLPANGLAAARMDVPFLSQWDVSRHPAGSVCSPTCLAMVAQHYGLSFSPDQMADLSFDPDHKIYGNWTCNMLAMSLCGFRAVVEHADGLNVLDEALQAGQPLVTSIAFDEAQLSGAPIPSSQGHLVVVAGITDQGDYWVRDPAARNPDDWRVYSRSEFGRAWLAHGGVFYRLAPEAAP